MNIIEKGIESKEFAKGIDAEQSALTIIALLEGSLMIAKATGKPGSRTIIMRSLQQFIDQLK